ncbi:hypothetical protein H8356DRAFT_1326144 [Neocallimastix lanati (nom. inval.)]|nr:hypothetical protein H8356DRAFT_1326144 [Neocallimastix sp. JGI-2020a]
MDICLTKLHIEALYAIFKGKQTGGFLEELETVILSYHIKPCMSKYKQFYTYHYYLDNRGNSRANTCVKTRLLEGMMDKKSTRNNEMQFDINKCASLVVRGVVFNKERTENAVRQASRANTPSEGEVHNFFQMVNSNLNPE